ncbi:MAG: hypothetical protein HY753_04805 [Nitrospirae bacterium]|nr:hypothetical protein [Nitrospirota bacterium]
MKEETYSKTLNGCTISTVYISALLVPSILKLAKKYCSIEIVFWKCSVFASFLIGICNILMSGKLTISRLPCEPSWLPARYLCDLEKRNMRKEVNERIIFLARLPSMTAEKFIPAFIEFEIASDINNHVYLAYHLLARYFQEMERRYILYIPSIWWSKDVSSNLVDIPIQILIGGSYPHFLERTVNCLKSRFSNLRKRFNSNKKNESVEQRSNFIRSSATEALQVKDNYSAEDGSMGRIAVGVFDGLSPDRRNSMNWFWGTTNINPKTITAIYRNPHTIPLGYELDIAKKLGFRVYTNQKHHSDLGNNECRVWRPTFKYYVSVLFLMGKGFRATFAFHNRNMKWWILLRFLELMKGAAYWYDFFAENNIKVYIEDDYELEMFQRAVAMDMAGGINVLIERSLPYDNYSYLDNRTAFISFLAGFHSLNQLMVYRDNIAHKVIIGHLFDQTERKILESQGVALKRQLYEIGAYAKGPLILLCDEAGAIYGVEEIHNFFRIIMCDLKKTNRYNLIIKPKKEKFLSMLPQYIRYDLNLLVENKSCFILDPSLTISLAAVVSDLVISVPSTAMFTAMFFGKKTVVYNPYRTIRSIFYEQGLEGKSIFDDAASLLNALHRYLNKEFDDFGDCSEILKILDPYVDGEANERITLLLKHFLKNLSSGGNRSSSIEQAIDFLKYSSNVYIESRTLGKNSHSAKMTAL